MRPDMGPAAREESGFGEAFVNGFPILKQGVGRSTLGPRRVKVNNLSVLARVTLSNAEWTLSMAPTG